MFGGHKHSANAVETKLSSFNAAEDLDLQSKEANTLVLSEGAVLGGGAFSRVSVVTEDSTGREYALKRMRKSAVVACPDHVYCEQVRALPCSRGGGSLGVSWYRH